jgi:hypothetical protein
MTTDFWFDPDKPLNRAPGESRRANTALSDYYRMGAGRSLRALLEMYTKQCASGEQITPTSKISTANGWSLRFSWQARVARAEELQREEDDRILREERLARERERMRRRDQWEDEEWALAQRLRKVAEDVLTEAPNFLKTRRRLVKGKTGEPDQLIITVALDGNMGVKASDTASKLARLSTGNPTESVEIRNDDLTDETRAERIAALFDRARARRAGQADHGEGSGDTGSSAGG